VTAKGGEIMIAPDLTAKDGLTDLTAHPAEAAVNASGMGKMLAKAEIDDR
jgi:hypothetical protein